MAIDKIDPINKHYDVGVLGVWFGANYGSLLNGYAVYKLLNKMGKKVLMIHKIGAVPNDGEINGTHNARFIEKFYPDEDISPVYSYERLSELNKYCDTFLTGSDQIWHYNINSYFHMSFFMNFVAEDKRKISFGTSFGHAQDFTPVELRGDYRKLLQRFHAISVREESAVDLCKNIYGVNAQTVIEPVFCIDKEEYDSLAKASSIALDEHYILAYILDPTDQKRDVLQYYSERSGKKLIIIPDGQPSTYHKNKEALNLPNCLAGIGAEDFIKLFRNADFIISDSFHGTAFSIIFNKAFLSIANQKRGYARFEDLLGRFHLTDRMVYDRDLNKFGKNEMFLEEFDYTETNQRIDNARQEALTWLERALSTPTDQLPALCNEDFKIPEQEKRAMAEKHTVLKIVNDHNCSGCGVCEQKCSQNAIRLEENSEGFLVPVVDINKCNGCTLCLKHCTSQNPVYKNWKSPDCYAVMGSDEIRKVSSSGGMFTIAAQYVLSHGGVVCGAAYQSDFRVKHILVERDEDLIRLRGSKYIQSYASGVFPEIKRRLDDWQMVLYTGMPCQIAGLYSYLGKEYNNLYTIDLLCHGITSYKVFEKYHRDVLENRKLVRLEFKEKEPWGWHAGINAYFEDGKKYSEPAETDPYYVAYLSSISKNHTCQTCASNKLPRQGDLTMGDFWGIGRHDSEMNDGKGTSVVLINNEKGKIFFNQLKDRMFRYKEEALDAAISGNHIIKTPYKLHKNRNSFFEYFDRLNFTELTFGCRRNELYKYYRKELMKRLPIEQHKLYYLAKCAVEHAGQRRLVTWTRNEIFERILRDFFGRKVAFSIAVSQHLIDHNTVFPLSDIKDRSTELYIIAIDPRDFAGNYRTFQEYGYKEIQDYICAHPQPIVIEGFDLSTRRYSDVYGNTIEGYTGKLGKVVLRGCNNHIIIGENVTGTQNLTFDLRENSYIEIKSGNSFNAGNHFEALGFGGSTEVTIQGGCRFLNSKFRLYNDIHTSTIFIGEKGTFESNLELHANSGKKIYIGRDCMFSHDIDLWAGDGHSIFDVTTGENVNSVYEKLPSYKNEIRIGEHVWVAKGAFVLHGTNIGNGSIVGAQSVVKGQFPNNSTIAGNPAKLMKKDVAWSRDMVTDKPERCGLEYFAKTEDINNTRDSKKRKILILGGSGRMSSHLTKLCIDNGDDVTIAVRGKHKLSEELLSVRKMIFDRNDEEAVARNLKGKRYDVIIDCSGFAPQCVDYVLSNVAVDRYIYVSTFGTYAQYHSGLDVREEDLPVCGVNYQSIVNPKEYGKAKYNSELLIANKYSKLNYAIVRIPFVMSFEDDFEDASASRILQYVSAVVNEEPINSKNLDRRYNFVESHDEAAFLYFLTKEDFKGVVNFASQGDVSMREVIEFVEKQTGKNAVLTSDVREFPFTEHKEVTMNLDKCLLMGYAPKKLEDWFYEDMGGVKLENTLSIQNMLENSGKIISGAKIKNWIVTGCSTGLGRELALQLNQAGYNVAATSRNIETLKDLPDEIIRIPLDVRTLSSCKEAICIAVEKMGRIDVLVNNAGISHTSTFEETPNEVAEDIIETNYWGTANMIKAILPHMRENRNGTVINVASASSFRARNYGAYYVASKFAVKNLSQNLKFECRRFLRVMDVQLGGINTGLQKRQYVIRTQFEEYRDLPDLYPFERGYRNNISKVAKAIINAARREELPRDLVLGWDAFQQFPKALDDFELETDENKLITITTDKSKTESIHLDEITLPRNKELRVQNWLITGGSGGFGKVLALRLQELGYTVAVTSRDISRMQSLPKEIHKLESGVEDFEACRKVVEKAIEVMGSVDVLVNNATSNCWSSFEECPYDIMREVFYTNYTLPQNMIKAVLPHYRRAHNGTVVNISSIAGIQPRARVSTYSAAKAALEGMTRTLKSECRHFARFMAVELVAMQTGIYTHNPDLPPTFPEYQKLGKYTPGLNDIRNRNEIASQQIINVVNQASLPGSLLIGTESYLIAKDEIARSRKEFEENTETTLGVCEKV